LKNARGFVWKSLQAAAGGTKNVALAVAASDNTHGTAWGHALRILLTLRDAGLTLTANSVTGVQLKKYVVATRNALAASSRDSALVKETSIAV
jgi:hypothetical protein